MDISPFDFKLKEVDSAVRFSHYIIEKAKYCIKLLEENRGRQTDDEILRLLRVINQNESNYQHIRDSMDINSNEKILVEELRRISRDIAEVLAYYKKKKSFLEFYDKIDSILRDIIKQEILVNRILKLFEREVEKGEGIFFAGIDAGGTKTRCKIYNGAGKFMGEGSAGAAFVTIAGFYKCIESLILSLKDACKNAGINYKTTHFGRIAMGYEFWSNWNDFPFIWPSIK